MRAAADASSPSTARIGATRPARSAGRSAPTTVTTRPTRIAATTALVCTAIAPTGMPRPFIALTSPCARPKPTASPTAVPTTPIASASTSTVRAIIAGVEPSVRSIPISRIRCKTVMLKLLRIRKPPTNSATPEKK